MATGKKYYWIKLRKDFMTSDTVDFLMGQSNGAQYVVLYQMLCLMCINTQGQLSRKIGEIIVPFDIDKIQRDCKYFSRDTVVISLELFKKLNLIYEQDDGVFTISEFDNIVGSETDYAAQKRIQRQSGGQSPQPCPQIVHTEKEIRVRDIELDIRDKNLDKDKDICAESIRSEPKEAPVIMLPLNTGKEFPVYNDSIREYIELYPAVDVLQALRGMKGWLIANPTKRKTLRGINRFINSWLAREQDKGGVRPVSNNTQSLNSMNEDPLRAMIEGGYFDEHDRNS